MKKILIILTMILTVFLVVACDETGLDLETLFNEAADSYVIDTDLSDDILNIPSEILVDELGQIELSFISSNTSVILANGTIVRGESDVTVTVTITFTHNEFEKTRDFTIIIVGTSVPVVKYAVIFHSDGGSVVANQEVIAGQTAVRPTDPTKEGFTFGHWQNVLSSAMIPWDFDTPINSQTTLIAIWEPIVPVDTFTVTFDSDGGTAVTSQTVVEGSTAEQPVSPTKAGYTFLGWFIGELLFDFDTAIESNTTLIAGWEEVVTIETFEVTFDADGGSLVVSQEVASGDKANQPLNPTRNGFTFLGWYLADILFDFDTVISTDITLTAKWEEIETTLEVVYEHNFDVDGKTSSFLTFDSVNNVADVYGTYSYLGYEHTEGYKINSSGTITFTTAQDDLTLILVLGRRTNLLANGASIVKVGSYTHSFVEQFVVLEINLATASTYTIERVSSGSQEFGVFFLGVYASEPLPVYAIVTFDSQGGTSVPAREIELGYPITAPAEPTKTDVDFIGWSLSPETYIPFDFETYITDDLTLYAHWAVLETYTVTADGHEYLVKEGKLLPTLTHTFIEGKVFLGWILGEESFDLDTPITSDLTLEPEYRDANQYELTLELNGGLIEGATVINYYEYEDVLLPTPTKEGHVFIGWFTNSSLTVLFTANKLTTDLTLYAKFVDENDESLQLNYGAYYESIYATFEDSNPAAATVSYKKTADSEWTPVDQALVRKISPTTARVDVVGMSEGYYDLMITTSLSSVLLAQNIFTQRYDRSGYAHFNYTEGVGAYKDDGTLKDDAVVVYVTDENKDTVTIPGIGQTGIGWILNNNQYHSSNSSTYNPAQAAQSLSAFNKPLVVRFIGTINVPAGATIYNSTGQGGSDGDNGDMVRIKNANHVTIEGIGDDAVINGWGFHFMADTVGRGIGFEARNLTFKDYSEDALGMEGTNTVPVRRGWWHNLTFFTGHHPNPAEGDKANGDGAADFKRGEYLTISYSVFDGATKTNLIGATNSDLTYHITMHHNLWRNNSSRIPLTRRSNIHMYNNVIEITDDNTNETGYAQNPRLDAYIFSEANFFQGTKNPSRVDQGGIKSLGDIKYSTYGEDEATVVTDRTTPVNTNNLYPNFDTNPAVFYYDAVNQRSNVEHLTDAVTARAEVMAYAGHFRAYSEPEKVKIHNMTPTVISDSVTQPGIKINKGVPLLVFTIHVDATIVLTTTSTSYPAVLVTIYGEPILRGSGTAELTPGTYVIESAQARGATKGSFQGKDSQGGYTITLDSGAAAAARIAAAQDAIAALPDPVNYTAPHKALITTARNAYDALTTSDKTEVSETPLLNAESAYLAAGIAFVETTISDIGVVTEASLSLIAAARTAYNQAETAIQNSISNYQVLLDAEAAFEAFHVTSIINLIDGLPDVSEIGIGEKSEIEDTLLTYQEALDAYNQLSSGQKSQVTNSQVLFDGITALEEMLIPYEIMDIIDALDLEDITYQNSADLVYAYETYQSLTEDEKALFSNEQIQKLEDAWEIYDALEVEAFEFNPSVHGATAPAYFTLNGTGWVTRAMTQDYSNYNFEDLVLTQTVGMNSSGRTISFTTSSAATVVIIAHGRTGTVGFTISGIGYTSPTFTTPTVFVIEVPAAGTYTIARTSNNVQIMLIRVTETK